VGCAGDLGNDAKDDAIIHQLIHERGGLSKPFQATLARISALVVDALAGGIVRTAWQDPFCPCLPRDR
jgi:hypothetical protein